MRKDGKVIERIINRRTGVSDEFKIGLIIEGGGMRGVFGGGAMIGLESLGLTNCFDHVYGTSSGSCSGAYFLSGQAKDGASIYWEDLKWFNFIKPWKLQKIMDLDFLFDVVMKKVKPLKTRKLISSKSVLKVFMANAETGSCISYTNHDNIDFLKLMKASCAMPGYYNKIIEINGNKHLDGNIGKAIPIEEALTDGCTDVLVVTTVPEGYRRSRFRQLRGSFKELLAIAFTKQFRKTYKLSDDNYNDSLDIAFGVKPIHRKINIYTVSPDYLLFAGEIRPWTLRLSAANGIYKIREAFLTEEIS
ncbi:MAG: patatin-like phospholipase family protein [bacterium]